MSEANIKEQSDLKLGETQQAEPLYNYKALSMLTIKNPNNRLDKEELMRVLFHLKGIVGFSLIYFAWYEMGKQEQQHIHAIFKKTPPKEEEIMKMSKSFKQKKLRYLRYFAESEPLHVSGLGDMLTYEVDLSNVNWKITGFDSQGHLNRVIYEYRFKELSPDFIDE